METRSLSPKHADAPMVPIIGMGTSKTLDIDDLELAGSVVSTALDAGTTLFDSSPMYGKAERMLGTALGSRRWGAVVATKVWTDDDAMAERQIAASLGFYSGHIELLQIHNMVRWPERLRRIEELRDSGQVTLVGATHWQASSFGELEAAMVTATGTRGRGALVAAGRRARSWGADHAPVRCRRSDAHRPIRCRACAAPSLRHRHVGTGVAAVGTEPPGHHRDDPGHVEAEQGRRERRRR